MQRLTVSSQCSALNSSTNVRHVQRPSVRQAGRLTHIQESSFTNGYRISLKREQAREVLCHGLFGLGAPELAVIAGVVALIYGPSKLPELGRGLGKTAKSFQSAAKEFEKELKEEMKDDEEESEKPSKKAE